MYIYPTHPPFVGGTCPNCGRCPTCGRGSVPSMPYPVKENGDAYRDSDIEKFFDKHGTRVQGGTEGM